MRVLHCCLTSSRLRFAHCCSRALRRWHLGAFRVKNIAARLVVWTAVLYAALAMPLLGMMLPSVSLQVPAAAAQFRFTPFWLDEYFRGGRGADRDRRPSSPPVG